jgi:enamine deaminase RidA (YjgF/YER057c/UK114 family)
MLGTRLHHSPRRGRLRVAHREESMTVYMEKTEFQKSRAFSPAVITQGGRTVWLAGQTATRDAEGRDIAGNFDAQVNTTFALLDATLRKAGGTLADMVTMTVFINDPRHGDRFVEMRRGFFPDGNFPASAMITVSHFARPGMLIEIQGVAVIGG